MLKNKNISICQQMFIFLVCLLLIQYQQNRSTILLALILAIFALFGKFSKPQVNENCVRSPWEVPRDLSQRFID